MRVYVILPAAGLGTRMTAGHSSLTAPKQFLELAGVPILIHTLRAFADVPQVTAMYVAVRASEMDRVSAQVRYYGFAGRFTSWRVAITARRASPMRLTPLNATRTTSFWFTTPSVP